MRIEAWKSATLALEDAAGLPLEGCMDLRAMRELAGITQFALSRRSGVSRMRLSLAECGEAELSDKEEEKITNILLAAIQRQHTRTGIALANACAEQSRVKT